eukprot:GILI01003009.1.p2 GENE.GILI01003009.1~~GILI01003009.1.p2  ORF type:complete len:120 (-),score=40.09 GILI01003009.1:110-469(-)
MNSNSLDQQRNQPESFMRMQQWSQETNVDSRGHGTSHTASIAEQRHGDNEGTRFSTNTNEQFEVEGKGTRVTDSHTDKRDEVLDHGSWIPRQTDHATRLENRDGNRLQDRQDEHKKDAL